MEKVCPPVFTRRSVSGTCTRDNEEREKLKQDKRKKTAKARMELNKQTVKKNKNEDNDDPCQWGGSMLAIVWLAGQWNKCKNKKVLTAKAACTVFLFCVCYVAQHAAVD